MLVSSTYPTALKRDYPGRLDQSLGDHAVIAAFFHLSYLAIFTPSNHQFVLAEVNELSLSYRAELAQRRLWPTGGLNDFATFMSLAVQAGLFKDPVYSHVVKAVLIGYSANAPSAIQEMGLVPFDETGAVYAPIDGLTFTISLSEQGLHNLLSMKPLHRLLAAIILFYKDDLPSLDLLYKTGLGLISTPAIAVGTEGGPAAPIQNALQVLSALTNLNPEEGGYRYTYGMLSTFAWRRFIGQGMGRVYVDNPVSASAFVNMVNLEIPLESKLRQALSTLTSMNVSNVRSPCYLSDGPSSPGSTPRVSLEAVQLITDSDTVGGGEDTTDTTSDGSDPATDPITNSPADNDAQDNGNNPAGFVMSSNNNSVNNSIGGETPDNPFGGSFVPVSSEGKSPEDVSTEYHYLLAVSTLNTRLKSEAGADVSPEIRSALDIWCRVGLWVYPTQTTRDLMARLGLQKILTPFK